MRRWLPLAVMLLATAPAAAEVLEPGQPLTGDLLATMVEAELAAEAGEGRLEVTIERPALPLPARAAQPTTLRLEEMAWSRRGGRFDAVLVAELPTGEASRIIVGGRAALTVEVTVPVRTLPRGTLLTAQDLERRWLPAARLPADMLADTAQLVGSEAVRPLAAGRPVRAGDLGVARLIRRGETVTVVYKKAGIELAAVGEAQEDAGAGEIVRVLNIDSRAMRRAVVTGPRRVEIVTSEDAP